MSIEVSKVLRLSQQMEVIFWCIARITQKDTI
jgi:hypothetical protein